MCCCQVLLFHDQSYEIHYEYTVSLNTTEESAEPREPEQLYIWTHSSWQDCTVQCGGGDAYHSPPRLHRWSFYMLGLCLKM